MSFLPVRHGDAIRTLLFFSILTMTTGAPRLWAQSPNRPGASPKFEVASVKVSKTGDVQEDREDIRSSPGALTVRHASLKSCIKWAYDLNDFQISGPRWLSSDRFDIVAKAASPAKEEQLRLMLQTLLAERFKLALHRDRKEAQGYVLVIGKGGPKFHESKGEGASTMTPGRFGFVAQRISTAQLAEYLAIPFRRPVLDLTGLTGRYDIALDLTIHAGSEVRPEDMASLVLSAVQEQLGLKLEARKGPVEIFVIDHVEKTPTGN
jgi:uncharacterized protein (TIGR03435 family)